MFGVCYQARCVEGIVAGGACSVDGVACASGLACKNGICPEFAGEGESCVELSCALTHECLWDVCVKKPGKGESCQGDLMFSCLSDLSCIDDFCTAISSNEGDPCASEYEICQAPLVCNSGVCTMPASLGADCDEQTKPCLEGLRCFDGKCIEKRGDCATDEECERDSYCCTEAACAIKGVCIPYGEGPRSDTNEACGYETIIGMFDPVLQCEWQAGGQGDEFPNHVNVLTSPMVLDTPFESANGATEIIFPSYNYTDGGWESAGGTNINYFGVIRIIDGNTCKVHQTIYDPNNHVIASSPLAVADLDNDGNVEIVALRGQAQKDEPENTRGIVVFAWNPATKRYETKWRTKLGGTNLSLNYSWDGPSVHRLDDSACAQVIYHHEVFDGCTGERLNVGQNLPIISSNGTFSVIGKLDKSETVFLLRNNGAWGWDAVNKVWVNTYPLTLGGTQYAYADFGTEGASPAEFKYGVLDGIAEVVATQSSKVEIRTLSNQLLLSVATNNSGGAPNISDFDNDGVLEVGVASASLYGIYDPECKTAGSGFDDGRGNVCQSQNVLWTRRSYDQSARTGSVVFDFDGDEKTEVVYGDECYTRVYDGATGHVVFSSYRTSCTWYETPVIADVDNDDTVEIVVNSNANCGNVCPDPIDPFHHGLVCENDSDCLNQNCVAGFCRCTGDGDCNQNYSAEDISSHGYACTDPLPDTNAVGNGKVCRSAHPRGVRQSGVRVLRDRLDRWASSRNIWNQHAYNVSNINDDGTLPSPSAWSRNYTDPKLNKFRQNVQGNLGMSKAPDITGIFERDNVCGNIGGKIQIGARICNRGTKLIPDKMPASFYAEGKDGEKIKLCTSYTENYIPIGGCQRVECEIAELVSGKIRLHANDDGQGGRVTVECNDHNNEDEIIVDNCQVN